jgi:cleavage and polyadenylation specificity factor subunit 3
VLGFPSDFYSVTSNAHNHVHENVHPHADTENDLERVQRLAMFLESHFGEVHTSVPEPEKGHEDSQDEETPEPVLLIRLDEADALVHLKSMVSCSLSA